MRALTTQALLPALIIVGLASAAQAEPAEAQAETGLGLPVHTTLSSQFRMLAVVDQDPANDQLMLYGLRARGDVFEGGQVFLGTGLRQRFTAEAGESGFDLQDSQVGFAWKTSLPLAPDLDLGLTHEAAVFLPTSRISRAQDLYAAPQVRLGLSVEPMPGLSVAGGPRVRYRFHKYAERAGLGGGMNTQLDASVGLGADYQVFESERFGGLGVGLSAGSTWLRKYNSRDAFVSAESDQGVWLQAYDWEAHVGYSWQILELSVSVEQGGGVLRDGIVNTFLVHRDETELAITLAASL